MKFFNSIYWIGCGVFPICVLLTVGSLNADDVNDQISRAWKRRAELCTGVRVAWKENNTDLYISDPEFDRNTQAKNSSKIQSTYLEYVLDVKCTISGRKMYYEVRGERPYGPKLKRQDFDAAYDGAESKMFYPKNENTDSIYPSGFIINRKSCDATDLLATLPLRLHFLPLESDISGIKIDELVMKSRSEMLESEECMLLESKPSAAGVSEQFWISQAKNYCVMRYRTREGGATKLQIDIQYSPRGDVWIPSSWTASRFGDSATPITSLSAQVKTIELNPTLDQKDFQIQFPPGSVVSDNRPNKSVGRTGTLDYIVMKDGDHRLITWDERAVPYDVLLKTKSGTGHLYGRSAATQGGRINYAVILTGLVVAVLLVLVVLKQINARGRIEDQARNASSD